jgi:hypothetical protein
VDVAADGGKLMTSQAGFLFIAGSPCPLIYRDFVFRKIQLAGFQKSLRFLSQSSRGFLCQFMCNEQNIYKPGMQQWCSLNICFVRHII